MACAMDEGFWITMYRDVLLRNLQSLLPYSEPDTNGTVARISTIIETIGSRDRRYPQRAMKTLMGFVEEFGTTCSDDTLMTFNNLITDMQGTESIMSADVLWKIQSVYRERDVDCREVEEIDRFVFDMLFCARNFFVFDDDYENRPTLYDLRENNATFSRQAVDRYYLNPTPSRIPTHASIALVYWKLQIQFSLATSTKTGKPNSEESTNVTNVAKETASSAIQAMQRSKQRSHFRIGEMFTRTIRPYGSPCGGNFKLYSMRVRTTQAQVDNLKQLLRYDGYEEPNAYFEAVSSVLMSTSTRESVCTRHLTRDVYAGRGVPVLLEFDTELVQKQYYFIHPDQVLAAGYKDSEKKLSCPREAPGEEDEVLVIPGLLIRYIHMQKMKWGIHEGYKIRAEFVSIAPDNLDPLVMTNGQLSS